MRIGLIVAGAILAILGVGALMGKLDFTKTDEVAKIGDVSINSQKKEGVPPWAGIAGLVVGGVLIVAGAARKS